MVYQEIAACAGLVITEMKIDRQILDIFIVLSEKKSLHSCPWKSLYHGKVILKRINATSHV